MTHILWTPSEAQVRNSHMYKFMMGVYRKGYIQKPEFSYLYRWSLTTDFWKELWAYVGIKGSYDTILSSPASMKEATYFPDAFLNIAENLLSKRDDTESVVFKSERGDRRALTYAELYGRVSQAIQWLEDKGIKSGDRVAAYVANTPEVVVWMIACASIGAIWSSCSPDFGVKSVLDRFGQIQPRVLLCIDEYFYKGKQYTIADSVSELQKQLPSVEHVLVLSYAGSYFSEPSVCAQHALDKYSEQDIKFTPLPFNTPLYILFSSGTTGAPKCIVHGAGGTLLQHCKEHQLHCDIKESDRVFYFTTCGWMMWNWLVSALASKATIMLYDGSPFFPEKEAFFSYAAEERITFLGVSAKYIDALRRYDVIPSSPLHALRAVASTGSPLSEDSFEYLYSHVKQDMAVMSISGGTDIVSCFVLGNPIESVVAGEIQTRGLGMAVDIYSDEGVSLRSEKGELVCTQPFPSMPLGFWGDTAEKDMYHAAYFDRFDNVWCHGDLAEITPRNSVVIYGRSDAVLNPGGVRIGTAEIYRQLDAFSEIEDSVVIGLPKEGDVCVALFVKMRNNASLTKEYITAIKEHIRKHTTPRHVPYLIYAVQDIPRTRNGKLVEIAVRQTLMDIPVRNKESLANPESLAYFSSIKKDVLASL